MSKADSTDVNDRGDGNFTDKALCYLNFWCQKTQDTSGFFLGTFGLPSEFQ